MSEFRPLAIAISMRLLKHYYYRSPRRELEQNVHARAIARSAKKATVQRRRRSDE
jgi:hypothetical protein